MRLKLYGQTFFPSPPLPASFYFPLLNSSLWNKSVVYVAFGWIYATIVHDLFSLFLSFRCHRPINDAFKVSGTEGGGKGLLTKRDRTRNDVYVTVGIVDSRRFTIPAPSSSKSRIPANVHDRLSICRNK